MGPDIRIVSMPSWSDEDVARLRDLCNDAASSFVIAIDAHSEESLPQTVRQWVKDGVLAVLRGAGAADELQMAGMAERLAHSKRQLINGFDSRCDEGLSHVVDPPRVPGVSVLIPLYQAGVYVEEAVASVLSQGLPPCELIVVDDGSDDDGSEHAWKALAACSTIPAVLAYMPHRGQAAARNTALALATGAWVFYLDADDVLVPDAIQTLLDAAHKASSCMVSACCKDFISPDLTEEEAAKLKINPEPYQRMLSGCTIIAHEVYDRVGGYDESLPSSETAQWMLRAKDAGFEPVYIGAVTMMRRYHNNNFGRRSRKLQMQSYMQIIKQRRAKGGN